MGKRVLHGAPGSLYGGRRGEPGPLREYARRRHPGDALAHPRPAPPSMAPGRSAEPPCADPPAPSWRSRAGEGPPGGAVRGKARWRGLADCQTPLGGAVLRFVLVNRGAGAWARCIEGLWPSITLLPRRALGRI